MIKRILTEAQVAAHQRRVRGAVSRVAERPDGTIVSRRDGAQFDEIEYPLIGLCNRASLPVPVPEFVFHPVRKWRFDYAWPEQKIAVEIEGGVWRRGGGAHSHPTNIVRDMEKYNAAARFGWRILRYAPENIADAIADLSEMF